VHVKLNTPAAEANGILKFWIDEVLVLDVVDYRYRDADDDHISHVVTPHMYGGGNPPPGPFGWQLDELAVWNGVPDPASGGSGGEGGASGAAGGSSGSGRTSATSGAGASESSGEGAGAGDPSSPGSGGSESSCGMAPAHAAPASAWVLLALVPVLWRGRRHQRRTRHRSHV
jgi:hypothetical protein